MTRVFRHLRDWLTSPRPRTEADRAMDQGYRLSPPAADSMKRQPTPRFLPLTPPPPGPRADGGIPAFQVHRMP